MNEQNVGNLDVEAILANEELMKRLAAKVLDIIQQKPDAGVVCQGYYCNMAKGDHPEDWKCVCKKKLDSLDMELEDGLAASVAEDYPLNAEELDQVVTEIKTSEEYSGRLSRADMSRAVRKVLADNEIMRRKGGAELMRDDYEKLSCTPSGPIIDIRPCRICGPNLSSGFSACPYIGSPFRRCPIGSPDGGVLTPIGIDWKSIINRPIEELFAMKSLINETILNKVEIANKQRVISPDSRPM